MSDDQLAAATRQALFAIVHVIDGRAVAGEPPLDRRRQYDRAMSTLGKAGVGKALGLTAQEVCDGLSPAFREAVGALSGGGPWGSDEPIRCLRLLRWCETAADQSGAVPSPSFRQETPEIFARKQVRAIELVLRAWVSERHGDQRKLEARLRGLFQEVNKKGQTPVDEWVKAADVGDVLSGTLLTDLANIFTHPSEFGFYEPVYADAGKLTFLRDRASTIRMFLEDIRPLRNRLAHHKPLSPVQVELCHRYYEQLVEPIQTLFDRGGTKVDPDAVLHADDAAVDRHFARMREDLTAIGRQTTEIHRTVAEVHTNVRHVGRKVGLALAGVAALLVASLLILRQLGYVGTDTRDVKAAVVPMARDTGQIRTATTEIRAVTTQTADRTRSIQDLVVNQTSRLADVAKDVAGTKKETSADPRKELANMGVGWDEESFANCVRTGDTRALELFFQGGRTPNDTYNGGLLFALELAFSTPAPDRAEVLGVFKKHGLNFKTVADRGFDADGTLGPVTLEQQVLGTQMRKGDKSGVAMLIQAGADPADLLGKQRANVQGSQSALTAVLKQWLAGGTAVADRPALMQQYQESLQSTQTAVKRLNELEKIANQPLTTLEPPMPEFDSATRAADKAEQAYLDDNAKLIARVQAARRPRADGLPPGTADLKNGEAAFQQKDYPTAARLYQSSVQAGNTTAMVHLGGMYMVGLVVAKDPAKAIGLFRQADAAGNPMGAYALAVSAESGQGLDRDHAVAVTWMKKSAAGGYGSATAWLQKHGH